MAPFPVFPARGTLDPPDLCSVCIDIPLSRLPFEEEDGYPHHLTLDALNESGNRCVMCAMLYWAAQCSLVDYGGTFSYKPAITLPSGEKLGVRSTESTHDSFGKNGGSMLDFSGPIADTRPPIQEDLIRKFPKGTVKKNGETKHVRPWLFGNWYETAFAGEKQLLMIGLGIRLGTSGKIEDSVDREKDTVFTRGSFLRFRTDKETSFIPGRLRASDSASPYAFDKVKSWLKSCDQDHPCVDLNAPKPLPTRVLDCSAEHQDMVYLRESGTQKGRYLALSHCWGTTHRLTLTKDILVVLKNGILLSQLPKTFQNAVQIARELKIQFLWIDSLCIIQDDAADWEIEASRMGDVYANSYVTVAALSSKDDSSGCFPDTATRFDEHFVSADVRSTGRRSLYFAAPVADFKDSGNVPTLSGLCHWVTDEVTDSGNYMAWLYMTPEWMPSSSKRSPNQYLIGKFGGKFDPIAGEPLSERAWTLQERLLAPRTIHYGRTEMYWECQCCVFAEDGAMFPRNFSTANDLWTSEPRELGKTRHWRWVRLVEQYSARKLTKDFDKLPALSGLANLVAAKTGDTYLAGLWKSNLMTELCWAVKTFEPNHSGNDQERDTSKPTRKKSVVKYPSEYRAPSWSWASIDAEIDYVGASRDSVQLATCIDVSVKPLGKDVFGRLASGSLTLNGPLYDLSHHKLKSPTAEYFPFHTGVCAMWSGNKKNLFGKPKEKVSRKGMALFDTEAIFPCVALFLSATNALVLKDAGGGKYVRIGSATFYSAKVEGVDKVSSPIGTLRTVVII